MLFYKTKKFTPYNKHRSYLTGFTLIELLIVIAIIGILAAAVIFGVKRAVDEAADKRKIADFKTISTALYGYYAQTGTMIQNYNPCCGACEGGGFYEQGMQDLINLGLLTTIPKSPDSNKYCYYNYGGSIGVLIKTGLRTYTGTNPPIDNSCRPFTTNWCSYTQPSNNYCVCNRY